MIITSGQKYSDIDIVASALPYKNLCDLKEIPSKVILPGPLNESVTKSVRNFLPKYETELKEDPKDCEFVIVDISDPKHFANFVRQDKIIKLYDHRFWGREFYWKEKLEQNAVIEPVGTCATLIWEEFVKAGLEQKIDKSCANLMYIDIIAHTLNLKSSVTTARDQNALNSLNPLISLPKNFLEIYYDQVNGSFMKDPEIGGVEYGIIQVELWDSRKFIEEHKKLILNTLTSLMDRHPERSHASEGSLNPRYSFLTSPSISEGHNYIVTASDEVKELLEKAIGAKFNGNIGQTPKLLLRKEILKILAAATP